MTGTLDWLVSYPRSGNTWTRLLLRTIIEGRPIALDQLGSFGRMAITRAQIDALIECDTGLMKPDELQQLRARYHAALAAAEAGRMVKVHDAWTRALFDPRITGRTIYILRDPRDVAVSWASYSGIPIDQAIAFLADPDAVIGPHGNRIGPLIPQYPGTWSSHTMSWIDESGLAPLVIRYEDMLADTPAVIRRIAAHLNLPADEALVMMAAEATRFDRLATMERSAGFAERPRASDSPFFRQGRANAWRDSLTPAQEARIRDAHGAVMARFGYC